MSGAAGDDREYGKLYPVARAILSPLFKAGWRIHLEGADNLPADGPAIICPNHTSVIDSFLLPSVLPRRITFVGKAEYLDDWKTRHLFPALGMIPIDRSGGDASTRALDAAAGVLARGELFGIYPEGTRSRDGRLHKGHTGPARLALRTGAPLVPVGIVGTRHIQPPGAKAPRPFGAAEIRIGRPIDPALHGARADDRLVLRQLTDELMFEVRELSGQEYVDEYATRRHEALPSQPTAIVLDSTHRHDREPAVTGSGAVSAAR
jgi:1-acyl-sn-glycerol-3-phosphate acyltransferase